MSAKPETLESLRGALVAVPAQHSLYPDAQLFAAAPADEQDELLQAVKTLTQTGIRNMGALTAWEIVFAVARCAARKEAE